MIENLDFDVLSFRDQQVNDYVQKSSAQFDFSNVSGLFNAGLNPTDKTWPDKGSISYKVLSKEMLLQKGYLPGPLQQMQFSLQLPSPGRIEVYLDTTAETDFPLALIRRSWTFVGYLEMNGPEGIATLSFLKPYYWSGTKDLIARIYFQNATGNDFAIGTESTFATNQDFSMMDGHVLQTANNCSVRVPKVAFESIDQEISIGFWAFGADTSANVHTYFANGADASGSRNINIHLPWENNEIYWDCGGSNGSFDRINVTAQPADCYGRWNYWMFTKDASKGIMEIFLNGNKVQSGTGKTQPIHLESLQFLSAPESATGWFGMVDEITIWSKRLTEAQVDSAMLYSPLEQSALDESLEAYYDMNTPSAVEIKDLSPKLNHAKLSGIAQYLSHQKAGAAYSYNSENMAISMSPVIFDADRTEISRTDIFDTFPQAAALLKEYEKLDASTISLKSQVPVFLPAYSTTKTANGEILSKIWQASTDTIHNSIINYLRTSPSKFQLLSFVTPYGNGLNLGAQGRTWYFDMTEYAPVLRGNKFLSMEDGGQNQEEMDLTFYYIKGRPARKVLDITNVYRPGRGYIQDIIIEKVFPVKSVQLPQADQYVLRAEITGHGQDGEFIPRMHQISLNGGTKLENFEVWKACGAIPVYPQGGTWIFDRAGWCPGDPSDVHHFDITQQVSQMEHKLIVDYNVLGGTAGDMNYLQSLQIVSYAPPTFQHNVTLLDIITPSTKVEYSRYNPSCQEILFTVVNHGSAPLESFDVNYRIQEGDLNQYSWVGDLAFGDTAYVSLPKTLFDLNPLGKEAILEIELQLPGANVDEYLSDNFQSTYVPAIAKLSYPVLLIEMTTNKVPQDNEYRITNQAGTVILERKDLLANTTYKDELMLPSGCYRLEITDATADGLAFWFTAAETGSGSLALKRMFNNITLIVKSVNPDFGKFYQFDFTVENTVATEDLQQLSIISAYPNPGSGTLQVEVSAQTTQSKLWLTDLQGRNIRNWTLESGIPFKQNLDNLSTGMYLLHLAGRGGKQVLKIVVQ